MSTIYLNNPSKPIRPPHSNDCNGHNTSISVGGMGNGHWVGDGCPCDGSNPETDISFIVPLLIIIGIIIVLSRKVVIKLKYILIGLCILITLILDTLIIIPVFIRYFYTDKLFKSFTQRFLEVILEYD